MLRYLKRITLANMASLIISCSTAVMSIELLSVRTWYPPKYCISVLVLYNTYNCVLVNTACALCSCYILDEADLSQFIHVYILDDHIVTVDCVSVLICEYSIGQSTAQQIWPCPCSPGHTKPWLGPCCIQLYTTRQASRRCGRWQAFSNLEHE